VRIVQTKFRFAPRRKSLQQRSKKTQKMRVALLK
jgi:hypothetical protein